MTSTVPAATLFPALVAALDEPTARTALVARLRKGPSWRSAFLSGQGQPQGSEAIAAWLLPNLAASPSPPTDLEVGAVAQRLAAVGKWSQVRELWDLFGQGGSAKLYDGDFEHPPRQPPFGWKFEDRDGALGSIERQDGGGHVLFAQFLVGHNTDLAEMLLVLPPGHYRLSGRARVDENPGGVFRLSLTCVNSQQPVVTHDESAIGGWRSFQAEFDLPQGCEAQHLRLAGLGGEGYNPARAAFDDLKLDKVS
jgi:hypothetical protein